MKSKLNIVLAVAVVAIFAAPYRASAAKMSGLDRQFVRIVIQSGVNEIALSRLALAKSHNPGVRQLAQMMIADHGRLNHQLAKTADITGIRLPRRVDSQHYAIGDQLDRLSGSRFDKAYINAMTADHTQAVSLFQKEVAYGRDPSVTNFATSNLNTIQGHLAMARDLNGTESVSRIKNPPSAHSGMM